MEVEARLGIARGARGKGNEADIVGAGGRGGVWGGIALGGQRVQVDDAALRVGLGEGGDEIGFEAGFAERDVGA